MEVGDCGEEGEGRGKKNIYIPRTSNLAWRVLTQKKKMWSSCERVYSRISLSTFLGGSFFWVAIGGGGEA